MLELPPVGTVVANKYRIEALLAQGGMGAVFRARHQLMGKAVALKWLHPDLAGDPEAVGRFLREARAAARIRHPNVVEVHDVGVHEGSLFMVMELLEGETFERLLERGDMPIPQALRLLIGAMHGVAAVHQHGIVHRDIKPQNVFVVYNALHPEGLAKVLDFGISKLNDDQQRGNQLTQTGFVVGTPMYMSLEQMNGDKDVDARADIYSFGVLLYRALTGTPPFDGNTFAALAVQVATHKPPTVKELRPELPTSLDNVVMKAISRAREHRHESIEQLIGELTLLASTEGFLGQMTQPSATPPVITPKRGGEPKPQPDFGRHAQPQAETEPRLPGDVALEEPLLNKSDSFEVSMRSLGRTTRRHVLLKWVAGLVLLGILWAALRSTDSAPVEARAQGAAKSQRQQPSLQGLEPTPTSAAVPTDTLLPLPAPADAPSIPEPADESPPHGAREAKKERRASRPQGQEASVPAVSVASSPAPAATLPEPAAANPPDSTPPLTATGRRSGRLTRDDFR
jgi:serine/threonine protein kinase